METRPASQEQLGWQKRMTERLASSTIRGNRSTKLIGGRMIPVIEKPEKLTETIIECETPAEE